VKQQALPKACGNHTPEGVAKLTEKVLEDGRVRFESILATPMESCTFDNVILPLMQLFYTVGAELSPTLALWDLVADPALKKAFIASLTKRNAFFCDINKDERLLKLVSCVTANGQEMARLDFESRFALEVMLIALDRRRKHLTDEQGKELAAKRLQLAELQKKYMKNLYSARAESWMDPRDLEGCPEDWIKGLEHKENLCKLSCTLINREDTTMAANYARLEVTQRLASTMMENLGHTNGPIFAEIVQLRYECAKILGYKSHAEYILGNSMFRSSAKIAEFSQTLVRRLRPLASVELNKLCGTKWEEVDSSNSQLESRIVHSPLREYFTVGRVFPEMLDIFGNVLGLKFENLPDVETWHPDVLLYKVSDSSSGELIGHLFFDLYRRDSKHVLTAYREMQFGPIGEQDASEARNYPAGVIITNFLGNPSEGKPILLEHEDVSNLFHEFGHAVHLICAKTRYSGYTLEHGERDFNETPSQLLENWAWDADVLRRITRHYLRTEEALPEDQIEWLMRSRNSDLALKMLQEVALSLFDQAVHSIENPLDDMLKGSSLDQLYKQLFREVAMTSISEEIAAPTGQLSHLVEAYAASFYQYPWGLVLSADIFTRFKEEGIFSSTVGLEYRKMILERSGTREMLESIEEFLGRSPGYEAFFRSIGLEQEETSEAGY
jgi:Zn-dependent oligopeptidase